MAVYSVYKSTLLGTTGYRGVAWPSMDVLMFLLIRVALGGLLPRTFFPVHSRFDRIITGYTVIYPLPRTGLVLEPNFTHPNFT